MERLTTHLATGFGGVELGVAGMWACCAPTVEGATKMDGLASPTAAEDIALTKVLAPTATNSTCAPLPRCNRRCKANVIHAYINFGPPLRLRCGC